MMRRVLACLFFAGALTLLAKADGPSSAKPDESITANSPIIINLRDQQSSLKTQYKDIKAHVNEIAEQLKNSSDAEKQEKGKAIAKALEDAGDKIERKFEDLDSLLQTPTQQKIDSAKSKIGYLRTDLQDLIKQLKEADKGPDRKKEIEALSRILDEIKRLAREQATAQTRTELERGTKDQRSNEQKKITGDTGKVIGKGEAKGQGPQGEGKEGKPGEAKGEGKNGENKGEGKKETAQQKGGEKEGEKKPGTDPKDPKAGPAGEAKGGKPGDPMSGEGKPSGKPGGDPKDPKNDPKSEGKGDPKKDPMKGDPMKGEAKESKSDSKGKPDGKGESKGQPKDSKGEPSEAKGDSKSPPSEGKGEGKGKPSGKSEPPKEAGNQPKKEQFPGKERVEEANEAQKQAEKEIDKGDNDAAAKKQKEATDKLKEAQKELEARLRQLRKDEIDRILGDMLGRCNKMLTAQKEVRDATVVLDKTKKSRSAIDRADINKGDELAKKEGDIIKVADDAIQLLREEGTSVAFPEVLDFVRNLMRDVRTRLSKTDPGLTTVATEEEIIRNLEEMIAALEKAKKENQQQPGTPPPPGSPDPNPGNKPLLQEIQELKLIRNMQVSVHKMTEAYGLEYKGKEQAPAPEKAQTPEEKEKAQSLKGYLDDLAKRQEKIYEVTNDLYKGKNK